MLFALVSHSQQPGYCGTQMPEEMTTWLKHHQQSGPNAGKQADSTIYYIPLKLNIVGNSDGAGYHRTSSILDGLCQLNEQYVPVGFHFYIYGDFNYINNTNLYEHPNYNVGSIIGQTKTPGATAAIFPVTGIISPWRNLAPAPRTARLPMSWDITFRFPTLSTDGKAVTQATRQKSATSALTAQTAAQRVTAFAIPRQTSFPTAGCAPITTPR
jgi:hypothetical protein